MKTLRLMSVLGVLIATSANALAQCNKDATGECDEAHGSGGCRITECCEAVCAADPVCCDSSWDELCVSATEDLCEGLSCPGLQPCDALSSDPGCEDRGCCRLVCDHDWFCCYIEWDESCIAVRDAVCDTAPCTLDVPANAIDEEEPCYTRLNDGCNMADIGYGELPCDGVVLGTVTTDTPRDTDWYPVELAVTTTLSWRLQAEFPAQLVLVAGPCDGPSEAIDLRQINDCEELLLEVELPPGIYAIVVSPGIARAPIFDGVFCDLLDPDDPPDKGDPPPEVSFFGLRYVLGLSCDEGLLGDLTGDGRVDGADILVVLGSWGEGGAADFDGNGIVDGADLLVVLSAWTG